MLGRHAEMFRARDNPGNALGQTMHRRSRCAIFREHMRSAPREALDHGQGMSCWAKHCADPAHDRHTALRRFPKRRTQGVVPPAGRECKFLRGARIPHVGWENTTRRLRGPRKSQLSNAMCKKMPSLAPGLGENLTRWPLFLEEKPTTLGVGGKFPDWCHGLVKISHARAEQLQARWEILGQAPGLG